MLQQRLVSLRRFLDVLNQANQRALIRIGGQGIALLEQVVNQRSQLVLQGEQHLGERSLIGSQQRIDLRS